MIPTKEAIDDLSYKILEAPIEVHRYLGPSLLESVYQKCLAIEFSNQRIPFTQELKNSNFL